MENKKKAKGTVLSLVLSILLVLNLVVCGVAIALSVANVTLGGSITFNAKHVNATISAGTVSGGTLNGTNKMQAITLDATHDGADEIATWSGLDLEFNESGDDVSISFTITNNSEEFDLASALTITNGTQTNATMTVSATKGGSAVDASSVIIDKKSGETTTSVQYTITFKVTDKDKSASISGFELKFNLEKATLYSITLNDEGNTNDSSEQYQGLPSFAKITNYDPGEMMDILYYAVDGSTEVQTYVSGTTITACSKIWVSTANITPNWSNEEGITIGSSTEENVSAASGIYYNLWVNGERVDYYCGSPFNLYNISAIVPISENASICFSYGKEN